MTYFDSFGVEQIHKEIGQIIGNKNITSNIFRIQPYDSIMCGYFCIGFVDFMLEGKSLTDFTNLISSNNYKINDKIILNYFLNKDIKMAETSANVKINMYPQVYYGIQ